MFVRYPGYICLACVCSLYAPMHAQQIRRPAQQAGPPPIFADTDPDLLKPTGKAVIEGTVVNSATGKPVRRATVMLNSMTGSRQSQITGADGRFRFADLPGAYYDILASREGYFSHGAREGFLIAPDDRIADMTIRLAPGAVIAGRVTDDESDPMLNVQVSLFRRRFQNGRALWYVERNAATDDLGQYRFHTLQAGHYRVGVHGRASQFAQQTGPQESYPPQFYPAAPASASIALRPGQTIAADVRLARAPSTGIHGHIEGLPANDRYVSFQLDHGEGGLALPLQVSQHFDPRSGEFRLSGIAPGRYLLTAMLAGGRDRLFASRVIDVKSAEALEGIVLTLGRGAAVTGKVAVEGMAPAVAYRVSLQPAGSMQWFQPPAPAAVAPDGTFRLNGVSPGSWDVQVEPLPPGAYVKSVQSEGADALRKPVEIAGDAPLSLEIVIAARGGAITGTVTGADKGVRAWVVLAPAAGSPAQGVPGYPMQTETNAEGGFQLSGIRPGAYRLFAFARRGAEAAADPEELEPYAPAATPLRIEDSSRLNLTLNMIPVQR